MLEQLAIRAACASLCQACHSCAVDKLSWFCYSETGPRLVPNAAATAVAGPPVRAECRAGLSSESAQCRSCGAAACRQHSCCERRLRQRHPAWLCCTAAACFSSSCCSAAASLWKTTLGSRCELCGAPRGASCPRTERVHSCLLMPARARVLRQSSSIVTWQAAASPPLRCLGTTQSRTRPAARAASWASSTASCSLETP